MTEPFAAYILGLYLLKSTIFFSPMLVESELVKNYIAWKEGINPLCRMASPGVLRKLLYVVKQTQGINELSSYQNHNHLRDVITNVILNNYGEWSSF